MPEAPVEITPYDPRWPDRFESERELLARALKTWSVGPIEHVGSTAVPGLAAKPVIDIMVPVQSLPASMGAFAPLANLGYCYAEYKTDVMHWFCKPGFEFRTHHLHLIPFQSALWHERLAFRDALRERPKLAAEYSALKRRLAAKHRFDREAYTDAKWPFIERVLLGE